MGRDIQIQLISCAECMMLAIGLFLYMAGIRDFIRVFQSVGKLRMILGMLLKAATVGMAVVLEVPAPAVLIVVYPLILFELKERKKITWSVILKGLIAIVLLILADLGTLLWLYRRQGEYLEGTLFSDQESIRMVVLIWLLMLQIIITVMTETFAEDRKWRYAYEAVALRKISEAVILDHILESTGFSYGNTLCLLLFIFNIFLDYFFLYRIEMLRFMEREENRRVSRPFNREEYYISMEEEHLKIHGMVHDMKNKLMILEGNQDNQSDYTRQFIREMKAQLENVNSFYHTGNPELDYILYEANNRAKEHGIDFEAVIQEGCLSFLEQGDLSNIFVNAIMNAIEACMKIEEGERKIQIQAGSRLNDVLLSFKNTISAAEKSTGLVTEKKDRKHHGLGIPSIQRAANRYKGFVSVTENERDFQLAILFVRE